MSKLILTLLVSVCSFPVFAAPTDARAVKVGGEADFEACGGSGITTATTVMYTRGKDGFWSFVVVPANTRVYFCDSQDDYSGIVIADKKLNCKVGGPIPDRQDYKGPCKSGWIKNTFLDLLAG